MGTTVDKLELTQHFTWAEATVTSTGLINAPDTEQHRKNILNTATHMEFVRAILGRKAVRVNSWYRSAAVNKKVGGVPTSEHAQGRAVDFTCPGFGSTTAICRTLIQFADVLNYNQLILEFSGTSTWVHISFPEEGNVGKKENLTYRNGTYTKGIA